MDKADAMNNPENLRLPAVIYVMAIAAGLGAANIHYSQPLLPTIAADLSIPLASIGLLPALTQAGFAIGILFLLPLADLVERRRLVCTLLLACASALFVHGLAPGASVLFLAAFLVGLAGIVPQLMTPFASLLAPAGRSGTAVGLVLSGVLTGVLASKVLAGLVAEGFGWRDLYFAAGGTMIALALLLRIVLPASRSDNRLSYPALLRSTAAMAVGEPRLRRHALNGGLTFASFMSFWATYALYLEEVHGYGPAVAGLFGIAGLVGAGAASYAGRAIDRGAYRPTISLAALLMGGGLAVAALSDRSLAFMVIGLLALDAGAGLSHAANQSAAFSIDGAARGRINSIYMSGYFIGGALGTLAATAIVINAGWVATCLFGMTCGLAILLLELLAPLRQPAAPEAAGEKR